MKVNQEIKKTDDSPVNDYYFGGLIVKKIKISEAVFAVAQSPMCCVGPISCGTGPFGPTIGPFGPIGPIGPIGPFGPFGP